MYQRSSHAGLNGSVRIGPVTRPRIVVVSELYYPETTSTAKFLTSFAEGLAEEFEVVVICGQPNYEHRGQTAAAEEDRKGTHIVRCRGTRFNKNNLLGRAINAFSITRSMAKAGHQWVRRGDAVLAVTNPPMMPPRFLKIAKEKGAKFVLLVHDVYPEALIASGITTSESQVAVRTRAGSELLMRGADSIIAIGRCMRELVLDRLTEGHEKVVVIPNYAETEDLKPDEEGENSVIRELGLEGKFVVQFAGNIGRTHGVEAMLEAAELLRDEGVHFLVVGSGARRAWLEQQTAQRKVTNVTIHDFFPRERLNDALRAGDVQLISFVPGMFGVSVPSRMYNVLAAGVPLIASADPGTELCLLIEEEGLGWSTPAGDGAALAAAIREAKSDPGRLKEMGARGRMVAERDYSEEAVREMFRSHFRRIFGAQ